MATPGISRRAWLAGSLAVGLLGSASLAFARQTGTIRKLILNPAGGYAFVPMLPFFSLGVIAAPGFELVRTSFRRPVQFPEGLSTIQRHLSLENRTLQALTGLELRQGPVQSFPDFHAFNARYVELMERLGITVGGQMPLTRTKVAVGGEDVNRIFAFTYAVPAKVAEAKRLTFMVSGLPDVRDLGPNAKVVAEGDHSLEGLRQKMSFVLDELSAALVQLGVQWSDVTGVQLYTKRDVQPLVPSLLLPRVGEAAHRGVHFYHSDLPVGGGQMEIDIRSTAREKWI